MEEDEPDFELLENPARVLPAQVCTVTFVSSFFSLVVVISKMNETRNILKLKVARQRALASIPP